MLQKAKIAVLFLMIIVGITGCDADDVLSIAAKESSEESLTPPVTVVSLIDETITFECLNQENCFPEINLDQIISLDESYKIGSVYYINSSKIFVILNSDDTATIIQLDPTTKETSQIPVKANARIRTIAHGKLVIAKDSRVMIIQDSGDIMEINVGKDIFQVNETSDNKIAAIAQQPTRIDGSTFVEIFIVDVNTGEYKSELLQSPNFDSRIEPTLGLPRNNQPYAGRLFTVDANLAHTYLFYLYETADGIQRELGMFNVDPVISVSVISNPPYVDNLSGYSQQYHNIAYSRIANTDGGGIDTMINLNNLTPVINTRQIIDREYKKYMLFVPFGDNFLLGTGSRVILVSLNGDVIKEYALPVNKVSQPYRIMEYRK